MDNTGEYLTARQNSLIRLLDEAFNQWVGRGEAVIYGSGGMSLSVDQSPVEPEENPMDMRADFNPNPGGLMSIYAGMPARQTLDLRNETLVPFKTKGKSRDGSVFYFVKYEPHENGMDWFWVAESKGDEFGYGFTVYQSTFCDGRAADLDSPNDIMSISHPWTPKINDEVYVYGYIARVGDPIHDDDGDRIENLTRIDLRSYGVLFVQSEMDSIGFVYLTDNHNQFWKAHHKQLKLVRRPR